MGKCLTQGHMVSYLLWLLNAEQTPPPASVDSDHVKTSLSLHIAQRTGKDEVPVWGGANIP